MKFLKINTILIKYGLEELPSDKYRILQMKEGECVVREGDVFSWFGILLKGKAKICRNSTDGKNLILAYYIEEGCIGEMELLTNQSLITTTVMAQSDVSFLQLDVSTALHEFNTNLIFSQQLARIMAAKLDASSDNYVSSALCTGEQRLCSYILQSSVNGVFREMLTDVSNSIGLSYRHLLRLMSQLCENQFLEKRVDGYYIMDKKKLQEKAM